MTKRKFAYAILFTIALLAVAGTGAQAASDTLGFVPAKTFDSYFVSNKHPLPPGQDTEFVYIDNYDKFEDLFGVGMVMGRQPDLVDERYFRDGAIVAVIHDGLWNMKLDMVMERKDGIDINYSAEEVPAAFKATTPLIIGIPKDVAGVFHFVENGKPVQVLTVGDVDAARVKFPDVPVAGGWTQFGPLDAESTRLFDRVMGGIAGAGYTPIAHATQVVNGINHRFICNQTLITNPPTQAIVMVSFHQSFDGTASKPNIETLVR